MEILVDSTKPIQLIKSDIKKQLFGSGACVRTCMSETKDMSTFEELVGYFVEKDITLTSL